MATKTKERDIESFVHDGGLDEAIRGAINDSQEDIAAMTISSNSTNDATTVHAAIGSFLVEHAILLREDEALLEADRLIGASGSLDTSGKRDLSKSIHMAGKSFTDSVKGLFTLVPSIIKIVLSGGTDIAFQLPNLLNAFRLSTQSFLETLGAVGLYNVALAKLALGGITNVTHTIRNKLANDKNLHLPPQAMNDLESIEHMRDQAQQKMQRTTTNTTKGIGAGCVENSSSSSSTSVVVVVDEYDATRQADTELQQNVHLLEQYAQEIHVSASIIQRAGSMVGVVGP